MPLLRGFAVRGRVFELSTGAGIVDAGISFRQVDAPESFGKSQSVCEIHRRMARSRWTAFPAGTSCSAVGARDHAYRELLIVVDEKTPPQEIALSAGATIAGMVTTTAGVPVKGRVHLDGPGPGYIGETNEAGQFSFNHMPPGRYRVSADTSAGSASA